MDPVGQVVAERERLMRRLNELTRKAHKINNEIENTRAELNEVVAALKVWSRVSKGTGAAEVADAEVEEHKHDDDGPTVKDAMWAILVDVGTGGLTAGMIREKAENRFGININPKTAGNSLWRLKEQGKAVRKGRRWYPVDEQPPEPQRVTMGAGTRVLLGFDEPVQSEGPDDS